MRSLGIGSGSVSERLWLVCRRQAAGLDFMHLPGQMHAFPPKVLHAVTRTLSVLRRTCPTWSQHGASLYILIDLSPDCGRTIPKKGSFINPQGNFVSLMSALCRLVASRGGRLILGRFLGAAIKRRRQCCKSGRGSKPTLQ